MSTRAPLHHRHPQWKTRSRRTMAIVLAATFLWLLTQIPYQIIRQERIRAIGEAAAEAVVTEVFTSTDKGQRTHLATYVYKGPDGRSRQRTAPFPKEIWARMTAGQRITIYYARSLPDLSRARDESENRFAVWLRQTVRGDELPERVSTP